jgi:hypothetical protein
MKLEGFPKDFKCPVCMSNKCACNGEQGVMKRMAEELVKEGKLTDTNVALQFLVTPLIDPKKPFLVGGLAPASMILTEACSCCGTIYARSINVTDIPIQLAPQQGQNVPHAPKLKL